MNYATKETGGNRFTPEDEEKIQQEAIKTYGRPLSELSQEEIEGLFRSYAGEQEMWGSMLAQPSPKGKAVGPLGVYMGPNWGESLGDALLKGTAAYQMGKSRQAEAGGRQTAAEIKANADQVAREEEARIAAEKERERRQWIESVIGRSY